MTHDGELAQRLTHPSFEIPKTYEVRLKGALSGETLGRLKKGVWLSDGRARVEGTTIRKRRKSVTDVVVTLHEGKNREIRRVMAKIGHPVLWLKRVAIGTLKLGRLGEGRHRKLTATEVAALKQLAEKSAKKTARKKKGRKSRGGSSSRRRRASARSKR